MDAHTLEKLDFQRVRELLSEQAACGLGRELALRISPSRREDQVATWLLQTEEFSKWAATHGLPPFGGVRDVRPQVKKAVPPAKLEPTEFAELADTLVGVDAVRTYFQGCAEVFETVGKIAGRLGDFRVIAERIGRVIDNRGQVRDEASERLYRIRHQIEDVRQKTREVFEKLLRQSHITKFLQYASATFHDDRMVLPVKADQRGRVPGIVHRSSDTGQTIFVEPAEAVELNNTRINLLVQEGEEIGRILWELTHLVHLNQKEILRTLETVAVVDLLTAKVKLTKKFNLSLPQMSTDKRLILHHARNPILMAEFEGHHKGDVGQPQVVPIDVRLGDDFDIMIITGPNTGGKTATLKTVGLLALMMQAGLPIPAGPGSMLPVFDGIWIDIGDEQSLVQSLSTFSAHLRRILDILHRARPRTLVLLDELGAGTDPDEGAAIGRAIVGHLLESRCLAMITTHLGSLKALAYEVKRVDNASVQFDVQTLRPAYVLQIGEPGNSNALAIASRLGMPKRLVDSARKHLSGQYRALNKAIARTQGSRRDAERARRDADMARQDAARATLAAIDRAKALEVEHRNYAAWVERVMKLMPGEPVHVRSFDKPGRVVRVKLDKQQVAVDMGMMQLDVALSDLVFDGIAPPA